VRKYYASARFTIENGTIKIHVAVTVQGEHVCHAIGNIP